MLGVAGWFGALFLLLFVGFGLSFIIRNSGAALITGVVACGLAAFLFRKSPENDFAGQFGLAVSMAGQALIIFGIGDMIGSKSIAVMGLVMAGAPGRALLAAVRAMCTGSGRQRSVRARSPWRSQTWGCSRLLRRWCSLRSPGSG
jgi:hypothetical protein